MSCPKALLQFRTILQADVYCASSDGFEPYARGTDLDIYLAFR